MSATPPTDLTSEFLGHMLKAQRGIRNYLFSLHPCAQDLDDLMQQTALTLWREFERFDRTREFLPWALRIGYFEVLRLRKQRSRERLVFSDELIELLAAEDLSEAAARPERLALDACLAKLTTHDREVLLACYGKGRSVAELADRHHISIHKLYRQLDRARRLIVTCVRRHLYLGDDPVHP
jgi:RNA polymerase sigma-70 factor (ECF subfamily)